MKVEVYGQPERDERGQLAEVGERRVEGADGPAGGIADVPDEDPRDEHGEETRAVEDAREPVDRAGGEHRPRAGRACDPEA